MDSVQLQSLDHQFPVHFENGYTVHELAFWCTKCGNLALKSEVHGQISRVVSSTADIWAAYHCRCGHISTYRIRLKDDKSCIFQKNGTWTDTKQQRLPLRKRAKSWYFGTKSLWIFKWKCFVLQKNLARLKKALLASENRPDNVKDVSTRATKME